MLYSICSMPFWINKSNLVCAERLVTCFCDLGWECLLRTPGILWRDALPPRLGLDVVWVACGGGWGPDAVNGLQTFLTLSAILEHLHLVCVVSFAGKCPEDTGTLGWLVYTPLCHCVTVTEQILLAGHHSQIQPAVQWEAEFDSKICDLVHPECTEGTEWVPLPDGECEYVLAVS